MDPSGSYKAGTGTWHRYKLGQAQFTKWLKQTADKLTPASNAGAVSTGEQSTKTQKKPKETPTIKNEHAVHWRELELMADIIAERARPEDIPSAPINILRGVVGLRKKSARFFERAADDASDEKLKERNSTHKHIIKVLDHILQKFDALLAKAPNSRKQSRASSSRIDVNDLTNMFECLDVQTTPGAAGNGEEETSETESFVSRASKRSRKPGKKKAKGKGKTKSRREARPTPQEAPGQETSWIDTVDFDLEEDDEDEDFDYYMMIYCFFEDFNVIRSHICELWCDYFYDRSVPLETLAVITNAASELFQHLENDLVASLSSISPLIARYDFMYNMLFIEYGMEHIDYDSYEKISEEEQDERMWKDEADWLAAPVFFSVKDILEHVPPGKVPMMRASARTDPRHCPVYGATKADDLNDFKSAVIFELLYEVAILKALKTNGQVNMILPAESELLLAFQDSLRSYRYSSSFIFSLQLFVDIRYILEDNVKDAFQGLQSTALYANQQLIDHYQKASGPRKDAKGLMRSLQKNIESFMLEDITLEDKKLRFEKMGIFDEDLEPFCLLKRDPIWAGLLSFRCKVVMSRMGEAYTRNGFLLEAAAYLYQAARAASKDVGEWQEMEKWLALYGDDSQLKRGFLRAKNDPVGILKNFENMLEVLLADAASRADIEGQTFKQAIGTRDILWQRYAGDRRKEEYFMEYMQSIIRHRFNIKTSERKAIMPVLQESSGNAGRPNEKSTGKSDALVLQRDSGHIKIDDSTEKDLKRRAMLAQLSPIQLLQILEETVTTQLETVLSVDYFRLFDESVAVLGAVDMCLDDDFRARVAWKEDETVPDLLIRVPLELRMDLKGDNGAGDAALLQLVSKTISREFTKFADVGIAQASAE